MTIKNLLARRTAAQETGLFFTLSFVSFNLLALAASYWPTLYAKYNWLGWSLGTGFLVCAALNCTYFKPSRG